MKNMENGQGETHIDDKGRSQIFTLITNNNNIHMEYERFHIFKEERNGGVSGPEASGLVDASVF